MTTARLPHPSALSTRVLEEQLRLTGLQVARFPLPVMLVDAFVAWLFWREGMATAAVAWFVGRLLLQLATTWTMRVQLRRLAAHAAQPDALEQMQRAQHIVVLLFGLVGVSRAVMVPLLFMHPLADTHYIFTLVCMAFAAAGVGNVAGQLRVYLAFALPVGPALSLGWLLQGSAAAIGVGLLLPLVFAFLANFVRDQGRAMLRSFQLVEDRERLTAELQQEHERVLAASAAKTRFLAAASHDLRQPVASIGLLVGLVSERVADAQLQTMLARVTESVGALEALLRGLLDLSRLDSGTVTLARQPLTLDSLYASIGLHLQPAAEAKGLRLRFRGGTLGVYSDPVLLQQVLLNLVDNAVRYTERGGVLVSARRRGDDRVLLQVWDSGRGIAADQREAVFEEFVQLDNPERDRRKGLGLGLAIVQRSAALLGHRLQLRSQPDRGSCFSLELPHERSGAIDNPALPHEARSLDGTVLWLLEDEPSVREALGARLLAWGAQVESFGRLAELEAGLARGLAPPHGLLTDHRLPDGNGLQAIEMFRARHGPVPALVLTGDTGPQELAQFQQRGVPVLHKPFRLADLWAQLATWRGLSPIEAAQRPGKG